MLYDQNKLLDAKINYERSLRGYEKHLGPRHLETIDVVYDLIFVHFDKDHLSLAGEMLKRVLEINIYKPMFIQNIKNYAKKLETSLASYSN